MEAGGWRGTDGQGSLVGWEGAGKQCKRPCPLPLESAAQSVQPFSDRKGGVVVRVGPSLAPIRPSWLQRGGVRVRVGVNVAVTALHI
jgi:hypothetical protein